MFIIANIKESQMPLIEAHLISYSELLPSVWRAVQFLFLDLMKNDLDLPTSKNS